MVAVISVQITHRCSRTLPATVAANPHWPCETEAAKDLFAFLSDVKVSTALRMGVGARLKRHGLLRMNEFKEAEKRLEVVPKAQWQKERISTPGWGEDIDVRWRDVLELVMVALCSPECDHTKLVWGPELECDRDSDKFGYMADLCNRLW